MRHRDQSLWSRDPCRTVAQIDHIAMTTDDLVCMCDFYRSLGGIASPTSTDPETGVRSCVLDFCGIRLEFFERPSYGEGEIGNGQPPALLHLGFALGSADAVDQLTGVVAAAGHRVLEPPQRTGGPGTYESVVLDPDGNCLKLTV
jgi:lactoylglutathione lyase